MRNLHAAVVLIMSASCLLASPAPANELMTVFTFNDFSTFPQFSPDVDNVPGTPTVLALGNNALPTPLDGNAFSDFQGSTWPAGDALVYGGTETWIGNRVLLEFDATGFTDILFSYDYLSTVDSGAASGLRPQGGQVFSQVISYPLIGDGEWHRLTFQFSLKGFPSLVQTGVAPNVASAGGILRLDNFQLVGIPEPSTGLLLLLGLMGWGRLRAYVQVPT